MADIHFTLSGHAGIITLDRQHALNAVTGDMLRAIAETLDAWASDDAIRLAIIRAAPGRAFSAGGDIRHLYEQITRGEYDDAFFAHEYTLNATIARWPKPYVALIDGIAMGGGVGVSFHGSLRVAGKGLAFAMPEVGIGFFPDVGGSHLLSRLPGALGLYLGLTGTRMKRDDALWCGLATHLCGADRFDDLCDALGRDADVDAVLDTFDDGVATSIGPLQERRADIDAVFGAGSVPAIIERLTTRDDDWARETLATMHKKAPLSLAVAHEQISRARGLDLPACMVMEYRILTRMLRGHDFREGIRAAIIDKDNAPDWQPADLDAVTMDAVAAHFEPAIGGDLVL